MVPKVYGAWEPTAVHVPLKEMLKPENFGLCTTEIFGPFQVRFFSVARTGHDLQLRSSQQREGPLHPTRYNSQAISHEIALSFRHLVF